MSDDSSMPGDEPQQEHPADAFVDGRTDYEKLVELLRFPEGTHLDFKADLDLDSTAAKLKFVKDVVAMSNCPPGGYILIGVHDSGQLSTRIGTIDHARFDAARLGDLVRGYIEGRVDLRVAIHDHDEHEIVVVFVLSHPDGLPVPMSKVGNCPDPNKPERQVPVFREGDLPVREGAANVPLRHSHWPSILAEYRRQVHAQATELAQALLREFIKEREASRGQTSARPAEIPLLLDMNEDTFTTAAQALLRSGDDVQLRRFLRTAMRAVTSTASVDDFETALDKWTVFCAQALDFERPDLVETAIEVLRDAYSRFGIDANDTRKRLIVVIRVYALGSLAVRLEQWGTVHSLALQPVPSNAYDSYIYSSWIRQGQVDVSRANIPADNRGGFLISAARELLIQHPAMRPDVDDSEIPPAGGTEIPGDDVLLNSLSQFDIAYCLVIAALGEHHGGYYPSSVALHDHRAAPVVERIVEKPDVRRLLFPGCDDAAIANAIADVYNRARIESRNYSMWWDVPHSARRFIADNGTGESRPDDL